MGKVTESALTANQGVSFIGLGKSIQNGNASPEVCLGAYFWQEMLPKRIVCKELSPSLEPTSAGSSSPFLSPPTQLFIHVIYVC